MLSWRAVIRQKPGRVVASHRSRSADEAFTAIVTPVHISARGPFRTPASSPRRSRRPRPATARPRRRRGAAPMRHGAPPPPSSARTRTSGDQCSPGRRPAAQAPTSGSCPGSGAARPAARPRRAETATPRGRPRHRRSRRSRRTSGRVPARTRHPIIIACSHGADTELTETPRSSRMVTMASRSPATRSAPASASRTRPPPNCSASSAQARANRRKPPALRDSAARERQRTGGVEADLGPDLMSWAARPVRSCESRDPVGDFLCRLGSDIDEVLVR
jgi:hypothetical protein